MADHLERLGLKKRDVDARIHFLNGRANAHIRRAETGEASDDWQRIALWGAAGSCMAQSASLNMLASAPDPYDELSQAARAYLIAGLPYGLIIESMYASEDEMENLLSSSVVQAWLGEIDQTFEKSRIESPAGPTQRALPANLSAINQQLYLCMTIMSTPNIAKGNKERLKRMMNQMKLHPNLPHGPQSQPLQVQLDIIEPVFDAMANSVYEGWGRAANALRRLALHYGESIESARHNQYLWTNLWSPVDYLDLEIVSAAKCVARAFPNVNLASIVDEESISAIPLLVAAGPATRPRPRTRR
jgi:hypothetical protein